MADKNDDKGLLDKLGMPGAKKRRKGIEDKFEEERQQARMDKAMQTGIQGLGELAAGYSTKQQLAKSPEGYVYGVKPPKVGNIGESQADVLARYKSRQGALDKEISQQQQARDSQQRAEQITIDRARMANMDERDAKRLAMEERRLQLAETKDSRQERQQSRGRAGQSMSKQTAADAQDANSELSNQARATLGEITGKEYPDSMTAAQVKQVFNQEIARAGKTPKGGPQTLDQKISKMSGEGKKRYDLAREGVDAVFAMTKAFNDGHNTFSLIGDNPYTMQRTKFAEALGRMNSGGAISSEEEARFVQMAPTVWDSAEIQVAKLAALKREMRAKLNTALGKATATAEQPKTTSTNKRKRLEELRRKAGK